MKTIARDFSAGVCLVLLLFASGFAVADPSLPWALRNHYSIPIEEGVLIYGEDNAEWRVLLKDETVLADSIGFSITLGDGTELTGLSLEEGTSSRDAFTNAIGDGTTYSVTFPPQKGLKVTHILRTFKARPFVFVEIEVENVGTTDVAVASIRPVVSESSVIQSLSPQTRIHYRRLQDVAGQPIVVAEEDALMAVIHDPAKPICFGVGLIPTGQARSTVSFRERDGEWHGEIACRYEPARRIAPGETLSADPLWISHGMPEAHRVDLYYSWAYSVLVDSPERNFPARGWYTLDDAKGLNDYVAAGTAWNKVGINHVLVGPGWEGRPGSLQGAASRFPKSMKGAVGTLTQAGMKVGISIDPLVAKEGGQPWTVDSSDGQAWINPTLPGAAKALAAKMKTLNSWGVAFVVVDKSMIPDAALEKFQLTRSEAQNAAYKALRNAAAPIPVFPASVGMIQDNVDDWLDVGSAVARMAIYGMVPGPLHFRVKDAANISDDLVTAASFWPGPIEFQGRLKHKSRDGIATLVARERVPAQPMDADRRAPRTWEVKEYDSEGTLLDERTISLSGARAALAEKSAGSKENGAAS